MSDKTETTHDWHFRRANGRQKFCQNCGRWQTAFTDEHACEELKKQSRQISLELARELEYEQNETEDQNKFTTN